MDGFIDDAKKFEEQERGLPGRSGVDTPNALVTAVIANLTMLIREDLHQAVVLDAAIGTSPDGLVWLDDIVLKLRSGAIVRLSSDALTARILPEVKNDGQWTKLTIERCYRSELLEIVEQWLNEARRKRSAPGSGALEAASGRETASVSKSARTSTTDEFSVELKASGE